MKIINKIAFALSLVAMTGLVSCSDKGYWDEAPAQNGIAFEQPTLNTSVNPGESTIPVVLTRSQNTEETTIPVTFTPGKNCPATISVPSSVTFEAGSFEAVLDMVISNATPPQVYTGTLKFDGLASYSGSTSCVFTIPVEYVWENIGTGKYFDQFIMPTADKNEITIGDFKDVTIYKAEGFERYRVMEPYTAFLESEEGQAEWEGWIFPDLLPDYVEFWQLEDGSLTWEPFSVGLGYKGAKKDALVEFPGDYNSTLILNGGVTTYNMWADTGHAMLSPFILIETLGIAVNNSVYPGIIQILLPSYLAK